MMMKQWKMPFCVAVALLCSAQAQAALKDWLPTPGVDTTGLKTVYAGAGFTTEMLHFNAEVPTGFGNVYAKVGGFFNSDDTKVAGLVGFRYPYSLNGTDKNGYYLGAFAGHITESDVDGKSYNRLGAGPEISYVWMDKTRISAASIGVGFGEQKKGANGGRDHSEPVLMVSYSINFGIF